MSNSRRPASRLILTLRVNTMRRRVRRRRALLLSLSCLADLQDVSVASCGAFITIPHVAAIDKDKLNQWQSNGPGRRTWPKADHNGASANDCTTDVPRLSNSRRIHRDLQGIVRSTVLCMGRRTELGASPWSTDDRTVGEWLMFSEREIRKLNAKLGPPRPGRNLDERLRLAADGKTDSVVGFLRVDFRMSKADTRSIMMKYPRMLVMPRETVVDRCEWLVNTLGLSKKQMGKMVIRCPALFAYGVQSSLAPVVMWLKAYLGLETRQVARLVVRLPQIFGLSPTDNLTETVSFLESLGLSRRQVAKMVLAHPKLFSYSTREKMIPMLDWLQLQLRADRDEVVYMVVKYPSLMGCSTSKNLAPKLSFLREILGASIDDIRVAVVQCPSLLGYSLEHRIRPRVDMMLDSSIDPRFADHKWLLTALPNNVFEDWIRQNGRPLR